MARPGDDMADDPEPGSTQDRPARRPEDSVDSTGITLIPAGQYRPPPPPSEGEFSIDPADEDALETRPRCVEGPPRIPGYDVIEEIGRGGMGVVYKARQLSLNRIVALKMVLAGDFATSEQLIRFLVEAETIGRLQHPNIVQIHEFGTRDGRPYFSLEYVGGGSLGAKDHRRQHGLKEAARLIEPLARAIDYAHSRGVVHRDLKPANVLLTPDGQPKLSDFGLAKTSKDSGLTRSGIALGTPSFMAPEQAQGDKALGPASDIFALGAILYQLLAGRPPFHAENPVETMLQVVNEEPEDLRTIRKDIPRDLDAVCRKCLAKDPAQRYASAAELAEDLQRYLNNVPTLARGLPRVVRMLLWANRHPVRALSASAGVLAVVSAFSAVGYGWHVTDDQREEAELKVSRLETALRDLERSRSDAEERAAEGAARLALGAGLVRCRAGEPARGLPWLARAVDASGPAEEPLRIVARENLTRWAAILPVPGPTLRHPKAVRAVAAGPEGRLATACADGLVRRWKPDGLPLGEPLAPPGAARPEPTTLCFDGNVLVAGYDDGRVCRWDADGKPVGEPLPHPTSVVSLAAGPGGLLVACADGSARRWLDGKAGPAVDGVRAVAWRGDSSLVVLRTGTVVGFDPITGKKSIAAIARSAACLAIVPNAGSILAGGPEGVRVHEHPVVKWDVAPLPTGPVTALTVCPSGRTFFTTDAAGRVREWELVSGRPTGVSIACGPAAVACLAGERRLLTACEDGIARLWALPAAPDEARSRGGEVLAIGRSADEVLVWDTADPFKDAVRVAAVAPGGFITFNGTELKTPVGAVASSDIQALSVSPDGRRLLALLKPEPDRGNLRGWDLTPGGPVAFPLGWDMPAADCVCAGPDDVALLGLPSGRAILWNTRERRPIGKPWLMPAGVTAVTLSVDGKRAAVGCRDGTVHRYDVATGRPESPPFDAGSSVTTLAFGPGGRLAAGTAAGLVWEVDAATGQPVGPPVTHAGPVTAAHWGPDGLTTGDAAGLVRRRAAWPAATPDDWVNPRGWAENLSGWRLEEDGTARPLPSGEWWREE